MVMVMTRGVPNTSGMKAIKTERAGVREGTVAKRPFISSHPVASFSPNPLPRSHCSCQPRDIMNLCEIALPSESEEDKFWKGGKSP